jgi:hypothetical protein
MWCTATNGIVAAFRRDNSVSFPYMPSHTNDIDCVVREDGQIDSTKQNEFQYQRTDSQIVEEAIDRDPKHGEENGNSKGVP